MPKQPITFGDGLQKIVGDLAQMELDPNADRNLINTIRETIIGYQQQAGQQAPAAPDMGPGAIPGTLETPMGGMQGGPMPMPMPVTEGDMSRGPRPGPDMGGAVEELSRMMAGS